MLPLPIKNRYTVTRTEKLLCLDDRIKSLPKRVLKSLRNSRNPIWYIKPDYIGDYIEILSQGKRALVLGGRPLLHDFGPHVRDPIVHFACTLTNLASDCGDIMPAAYELRRFMGKLIRQYGLRTTAKIMKVIFTQAKRLCVRADVHKTAKEKRSVPYPV